MLVRLIKTVIGAALLKKTVRNAFIVALIKSVNWILRHSTITRIMTFSVNLVKSARGSRRSIFLPSLFKGVVELALLRFARRRGVFVPVAFPALAALLLAIMRGREERSDNGSKRQEDQIIDLDEYTILDDRH